MSISDPEDWGSIYTEDAVRLEDAFRLHVKIAKLEQENAELRAKLTSDSRNKLILDAIQRRTEHLLSLPTEDLKEYLERNYDC